MSIHSHQVHCMHIYGWHINIWCYRCKRHWTETCGIACCWKYERAANDDLARAIVQEFIDGDLPIPVEILTLDLSELGVEPAPSEPSQN